VFVWKLSTKSDAFSIKERGSNEGFTLSTINFCPDKLPKLKDFPAAIGGSGQRMPE
jgi:hypothetical protein